ncbi:MAG: YhcH/YjgK/YiaL family protein [Treponema sp.]|nr:YhcH/YjgK/YiaL family protein [Treponema sp.]
MIFDSIKNSRLYTGLGSDFKKVFEFINKTNLENKAAGRYPLEGSVYYLVQEYETKPESEGFFEAHRKFIDLQYIARGSERHNFTNISALKLKTPYDDEKDFAAYEGQGNSLVLNRGFFAIYYPDDAHMPNLKAGSAPEKMLKVVFKIPV